MKRIFFVFLYLVAGMAWGQKLPPRPNPPKLVNDLTRQLLSADQVAHLERKLVAYDDSTSIQIAVVVVPTLNDYDPNDYATQLGRSWGVGNKKTNNGVVFLISTEPQKRKVYIAPGYGLEGALPDILCKRIIEEIVIPQFKQEHYYRGIDLGVDAIIKASRGEYKAPEGYRNRGEGGDGAGILVFIIILLVVIFILGRMGGGGPRGGMMSRRGYRDFMGPPIWFPTGGGGGGRGGGWSGGGGGFGGFGGGSFGGGGAGGSW